MRQPHAGKRATDRIEPGKASTSGKFMAALIAIVAFIAAIFLLNMIEFGRPD